MCFGVANSFAQSLAQKRAETLQLGMNVSYLDHYWEGSKAKHFSDFAKPSEAAKREKVFADIAKAGFKTVRLPICFSAWMGLARPYNWDNPKALEMADSFVQWALDNGLNVIIDLHHSEFDRSVANADAPERIVNLWVRIAERYKNTNPEKVFFELRNEPNRMDETAWRWEAAQIIKYVREITPQHTLIVGFTEWNGRRQLIAANPFTDKNIIYTFHYYDPFIFTHQGAEWTDLGKWGLKNVPFPYAKGNKIKVPSRVKGTWVENQINSYETDSQATRIFADLKAAKDWSEKNKVPIFVGEVGSYREFSALEDRCRHAQTVYKALGDLDIPNAWWEWDGGFNMFKTGTQEIAPCMRKALESFNTNKGK